MILNINQNGGWWTLITISIGLLCHRSMHASLLLSWPSAHPHQAQLASNQHSVHIPSSHILLTVQDSPVYDQLWSLNAHQFVAHGWPTVCPRGFCFPCTVTNHSALFSTDMCRYPVSNENTKSSHKDQHVSQTQYDSSYCSISSADPDNLCFCFK